ncbi:MAG: hypothetical protein OSB42_01930 [Planctomycetota bacterium]|nr:hypothetical protein [Planctomycetota bacterium]
MKNFTLTLLGLGAAPLLLSALPTRDTISFAPADGTSVTSTYTMSTEMTLDDMQVLMNGEENPMMPSIEMDMVSAMEIQVSDTYISMADGQPTRLKRTYDTVQTNLTGETAMEMMGEAQNESILGSGTSALEGETVLFSLKDGEYSKAWPEGAEADDDLLEGLLEDISLRGMLPTGEVAEGESWDIELDILLDVMAPGGDLSMEMEMDGQEGSMGMGPDADMMSDVRKLLSGNLSGSFTGKLSGYREVDGAKLAVIEIEFEIDCATDMIETIREQMQESLPPDAGVTMDVSTADVSYIMEGEGELLWNASAGHIAGMTFEAEVAMGMETTMGIDAGGQQMDMEMNMEMSGATTLSVTAK